MSAYKRLQYSPFDILIILSGIACIFCGAYFFNYSTDQLGNFRESEMFGTVKEGNGTRKLSNSLQWFDITEDNPLFYGDVIFANEEKDIEIELMDKESKLVVPEDSMIKITKSGDEFDLDVSRGSILFKTKGTKKIRLRDKRGKVRKITISKDAKIKISTRKSNLTVEAIKGNAKLTRINAKKVEETVEIKKDKILVVGRKKAELVSRLNIVSVKVADPLLTNRIPLTNKFKQVSSLEVSKSRRFSNLKVLTVREGQLNIGNLAYGRYYVRGKDKTKMDSFELSFLKPMRINISKQESYYPGDILTIGWNGRRNLQYNVKISGPDNIDKVVSGNRLAYKLVNGEDIQIEVTDLKYNRTSRKVLSFQISKLIEVTDIKEVQVKQRIFRNLILKNPRKLNYRIEVKDKLGKTLINKVSKTEKFLMKIDKPGAYDIKISNSKFKEPFVDTSFVIKDRITNAGKNKVIYSIEKELKANLEWKRGGNIPENMEYVIKIYKKGNKNKPFIQKKTKSTNYVYKTKKEEQFYWKIESTIPELIDSSPLFETKLARPKFPKLKSPKVLLKYNKAKKCYNFKVPKVKYVSKYDVYIFSSRSKVNQNRKAMYHRLLTRNGDCLPAKDLLIFEGKYYYKYRIIDRWKRKSPYSKVGTMFFPISPLDKY